MIWMMCTKAKGGMRSVIEGYRRDGLLDKYNVKLLFTHDEGSVFYRLWLMLGALLTYTLALLNGNVDVAHIHVAMHGSFWRKGLFASLTRFFNKPVILHLHGSEMKLFYQNSGLIKRYLIRQQLSKSDFVLVLSDSWRDFVLGVSPKCRVKVMPNYVPIWDDVRDITDSGITPFTFLFLGFLGKRKGIFDLIPAFKKVVDQGVDVRLIVAGNGDLEGSQELAARLEMLDRIEFVGWVVGNQKKKLLKTCDAFVLPSYNEGLPMSILEAMAHSKPVISTFVGGIPELITDGKQGILVEPGDQTALSEALLTLSKNPVNAKLMGRLGRATVVEKHSDREVLPILRKIYDQAISKA